ncbi:unnamed protein product, partial [marine sediment metagenome]
NAFRMDSLIYLWITINKYKNKIIKKPTQKCAGVTNSCARIKKD